jgi:hypothetical protein
MAIANRRHGNGETQPCNDGQVEFHDGIESKEQRDGYCRFTTLRNMGISKVFAYVGSEPTS